MWEENVKKRAKPIRQTYKELSWVQKNPRTFVLFATSSALLVLFSKPIYDAFFVEKIPIDLKYLRDPEMRRILEEGMKR